MEESTQERRGSEEGSSAGGRRSKDDHNIIVLNSARKRELEKIGSLTQALTGQSILRTNKLDWRVVKEREERQSTRGTQHSSERQSLKKGV